MKTVTMYNPKTSVTIETTTEYKKRWEKMGFVELNKATMVTMIV